MATKKKSSSKTPTSPSFVNSSGGILRRSTTNSTPPNLNYPNEAVHEAKLRRQEYNLQASAYANMNTSREAGYRLNNNQHSTYPQHSNRENAEDDDDSYDEEELQEEREENDAVVDNPNGITEERVQQHMDDKIEYVKRPQIESDVSDKEKANPITTATPSNGKSRLSHGNLPNYDPRMEYNPGWKGAGSVSMYGTHLDMSETYRNYYNQYIQAQLKKLGYRNQDFDPNKMPASASYSSWNKKLSEAWAKQSDSMKRPSTSRSPSRKEPIRPKQQGECVGAEDSTLETINYMLGQMELTEMSRIKRDLRDFQKARRRLIYDATSIKPIIPMNDSEKKILEKK